MTDPQTYIAPAEEKMELAVAYLDETLARIRAGKANPKILEAVRVEYYGSLAPISNVANISVPDARTIVITPWEKAMFKPIEKAIINSEVGKAIADAKFSKTCPCCGTKVAPDGDSASTLYWQGTGGRPAYWYTCPKCHHKFNNAPW